MPVQYEVHERIATIMLDRPEAMNSLDPESLVELNEAFQRANTDQDVRVVILTGAGEKAFCTGSDLKKTMPPKESFAELTFGRPKWLYPFAGMEIDKPTICAVNGFALAGGMELALACDIRIASDAASFVPALWKENCPEGDLNPHGCPHAPQTCASTNSAIRTWSTAD